MSLKDTLAKKLETQTDYWNKQIEKIRTDAETKKAEAKDRQAEAEIEQEVSEQIQDLQQRVDEAQDKLREVREAGESQIKTIQGAVESWLSDKSGKK
ncbi:MAG: hypothetical protein R3280_10815 [Marinobacter sp.]|uniref:hypothetical protein n=1 Tax=Marinobacter sp. TaxID=50741 RepID=UPI00299DF271|nr:hypothetical protein [Marinobacter sp.]MDX1635122.1 hypothetical protein [Marinobacter sp.]